MCCTNVSSLCKWFLVFLSIVAGVVFTLTVIFSGVTISIALPIILLILSTIILAAGIYIATRAALSRNSDLASCFCANGIFLVVAAVIAILLSFLAIAIISITSVIAVFLGVVVAFFTAALLSLVCFVICLLQSVCSC